MSSGIPVGVHFVPRATRSSSAGGTMEQGNGSSKGDILFDWLDSHVAFTFLSENIIRQKR